MGRAKVAAESDKGVKRRRKNKKVKDKDAPKRPVTAFFYYVKHRRDLKADQGLKVSEFTKQCGEQWRNLSAADKSKFENLSVVDKSRYTKEMAIYAPQKNSDEPPKPKKPATAFLLYVNSVRESLRKEGYDQKEVLRQAGAHWRGMDDDGKKQFVDLGEIEKGKYHKNMEKYKQDLQKAVVQKSRPNNGQAATAGGASGEEDGEEAEEEDDDDIESDDE